MLQALEDFKLATEAHEEMLNQKKVVNHPDCSIHLRVFFESLKKIGFAQKRTKIYIISFSAGTQRLCLVNMSSDITHRSITVVYYVVNNHTNFLQSSKRQSIFCDQQWKFKINAAIGCIHVYTVPSLRSHHQIFSCIVQQ